MTRSLPNSVKRSHGLVSESIRSSLELELRELVNTRDRVQDLSRELRQASQQMMRRIHAGETPAVQANQIAQTRRRLVEEAERAGMVADEVVEVALQESVEAALLWALVSESTFPSPKSLRVGPVAYLLGLSDLVGEMRRLAVTSLSRGQPKVAESYLGRMDEVLSVLMHFDAPRAVMALKHKQDSARNLIERTRGEVAMALYLETLVREGTNSGGKV